MNWAVVAWGGRETRRPKEPAADASTIKINANFVNIY